MIDFNCIVFVKGECMSPCYAGNAWKDVALITTASLLLHCVLILVAPAWVHVCALLIGNHAKKPRKFDPNLLVTIATEMN